MSARSLLCLCFRSTAKPLCFLGRGFFFTEKKRSGNISNLSLNKDTPRAGVDMKKCICILLCAALLSLQSVAAGFNLSTGARGAVMIEASTKRVLFSEQEHKPLAMASTTKIMTALITLEQPDLDAPFVVDPQAIQVEGSSMGLLPGDTVTLRALAVGMLLSSGNDAANAAAVRIAGSVPAFVELMNHRALDLGMQNTAFETPSGLDGEEHYSTAYDMALLAAAALQNEDFAEIASSKSMRLSYGNPPYARTLTNHNRLLWLCEDCIGIKTGFTKKAGRCLVTAAKREGLTLIMVTLGCGDDFNTHHKFYDEAFAQLRYFDGTELIKNLSVKVTGAEEPAVAVSASALGAYLTEEEAQRVRLEFLLPPFVYAPLQKGEQVGEAQMYIEGILVSTGSLFAREDRDLRLFQERSISEKVQDFFDFPEIFAIPQEEKQGTQRDQLSPKRAG